MKKHYRLFSGFILALIAVCWIVFLMTREKQDGVSAETKDMVITQLNNVKDKIKKNSDAQSSDKQDKDPNVTPTGSPDDNKADNQNVTPTPDQEQAPTPTLPELPDYTKFDYIVANVKDSLNIREGADQTKNIVGTLSANGYGRIIERGTEWFKIKSGNVTGYVSAQYILTDTQAISKMRELGGLKIKVINNEARIHKESNSASEILAETKEGDMFDYYPEFSNKLFFAIVKDGVLCYVPASYAEVSISLKTADKV